jgi:hypothetical protein
MAARADGKCSPMSFVHYNLWHCNWSKAQDSHSGFSDGVDQGFYVLLFLRHELEVGRP